MADEKTQEVSLTPEQTGVIILDVIFGGILDAFKSINDERDAIVHGEPFAAILLGKPGEK